MCVPIRRKKIRIWQNFADRIRIKKIASKFSSEQERSVAEKHILTTDQNIYCNIKK